MTRSIAVAIAVLGVAGSWVFGHAHPFGDPRAERGAARSERSGGLLAHADMPASTRAVLLNKCADCHSDETRWPVYARFAPASWLIERDVLQGRRHMNLSNFEELQPDERETVEAEIVAQTKSAHMPPLQYRLLHWDAGLSAQDLQALALLRKSATPMVEAAAATAQTAAAGSGDAVHGKVVFEKRCTGCHAMTSNREGPQLAGVFGRRAGSVAGFAYSAGLKRSGLTWDDATLERWLADPDTLVPENNMSVGVPKVSDRRDIIAYLKQ